MKNLNTNKRFFELLFTTTALFFCIQFSFAQPLLPQRTITVTPTQALHFGTFAVTGAGGSVIVGWDGNRSSIGDIVLLAMSPTCQPAIFDIKLCHGRHVTITFSATTLLNGSNGGSLTLNIGPTEKGENGDSFPTESDCNFITPLRVGGTLVVPSDVIPGTFSGSFDITFNQE